MASVIPGYEYDIFISYRQKDNKYDGWVTGFVDNLKRELEATFKEEISVYFDINPHDGLLETHDVDASLIKKLNCLILIPIISRTYCDPKSFAWDHEFKAFIELSSKDQFGLKITLSNGNVANRLLPVRINDLDISDIKLCESIIGSVFRGVDFIYKEPGVNRPLRSNEDNPHDNLNHTIYRNQINKVALAVKDIIESMKLSISTEQSEAKESVIKKAGGKKEFKVEGHIGKEIIEQKQEILAGKTKPERYRRLSFIKKSKIVIPGILAIIPILGVLIFFLNRQFKERWAKEKALPEIVRLADGGKYTEAYNLAKVAEKYIAKNPAFVKLWPYFSTSVTTKSNPPGAKVYRRDFDTKDTNWIYVGETPLDNIYVPYSFSRIKVMKEGFQTVYDVSNSMLLSQRNYILDSVGTVPKNMIHVPGVKIMINLPSFTADESIELSDYFIDKFEVTNKEYKTFIDSGGYQNKEYWKYPFKKDGKVLSWEKALSFFVDKTDRYGPSTWEAGDYPKGEDDYPVSGVSWYEAAAYAEFSGKSLPTYYHWRRAAGLDYRSYLLPMLAGIDRDWGISFIILQSNLNAKGSAPVGSYQGMTGYGTYDMVGNVREWCWNESTPDDQRFILGGGWNDATYLSRADYTQPPFDRSETNGFRCVSLLHSDGNLRILMSPMVQSVARDFMKEKPASDQQFEVFKRMYAYEKADLNSKIESIDSSENFWIKQKISFDAAYGNEHVIAYLFLPKTSKPPYQTVVYFPGSSAAYMLSSESLVMNNIDFIIKGGRAVIYPIYKGTYERQFPVPLTIESKIARREHTIQWYKDLARSIDYLKTRTDIDTNKIAYFGFSWGGRLGPIMTVLENRIKVAVLCVAGLNSDRPYPEVDDFNYVHRVKIPTLMLNGKYDAVFQYETSQKPMFELLGTSPENKRHFIYESGHFVPRSELIKETLKWLDKYLGPVK